ncbi:MAG: hypothetical protein LBM22_01535 [Endomicrobium sp.]|jgi:hypothetical protein|nr:hypothetical protein [Endomicrobium sp.]
MRKNTAIFFIVSHLSLLIICLTLYLYNVKLKYQLQQERRYNNTIIKENKILKNIEQILVHTLKKKCI